MISIDEFEIMLDDIATELPHEFYKELNGGILLLPEAKLHPANKANDLYVMGEYHFSPSTGRHISIYYGSFERTCGHFTKDALKEKLKKTLLHEFTHHMEHLAGERGLEIKDSEFLRKYNQKKGS